MPIENPGWRQCATTPRDQAMRHATCVVACSALKRRYRELLGQAGAVFYVFLEGSFALIHGRMHEREGHFMPDALLPEPVRCTWMTRATNPA